MSQVQDGHFRRGMEQMMPSALANAFKAQRLAVEGATTLRGDPIVGDLPPQSVVGQMLGFSPAEVARTQRFVSMQKAEDRRISEQRSKLFDRLYLAKRQGDIAEAQDVMEDIRDFSERHPADRITQKDINRSESIRETIDQERRMFGVVSGDPARWRREAQEVLDSYMD